MTDKHTLVAFLAVIGAIVLLAIISVVRPIDTTILGATMTGLIGVLGTFRPRTNSGEPTGTPADPVSVTETK